MAYPQSWPPQQSSGKRSIRFFTSGTSSSDWTDNGFMFGEQPGASNMAPVPTFNYGTHDTVTIPPNPQGPTSATMDQVWCGNIRICNDSTTVPLEFTFDGTNIHGRLLKGEQIIYRDRWESGVAVRGGGAFRIEAW